MRKMIYLAAALLLAACANQQEKTMSPDFLKLAADRYAVRSFSPEPVSQDDLDKIIEAGRIAPTSLNSQPQKIFVVRSEEGIAKIAQASPCLYGAPQCLVFCYDKARVSPRGEDGNWGDVDIAIIATHMMLEATSLGLGTCPVGRFDAESLVSGLGIPEGLHPVLIMPFGHPAADAAPSDRHTKYRPLEETVEYL